jgi:hypothetical protein
VVLKALAKDPQPRYVSVQLFAQALERASQMSERTLRYASEKTVSLGSPSPPLQMTPRRVFLCASQADEAFVARLTADLELRDIAVENEDLESPPAMSDQADTVRRAIRAAQVVFLVVSPHTSSSRTVREQLRVAGIKERLFLDVGE